MIDFKSLFNKWSYNSEEDEVNFKSAVNSQIKYVGGKFIVSERIPLIDMDFYSYNFWSIKEGEIVIDDGTIQLNSGSTIESVSKLDSNNNFTLEFDVYNSKNYGFYFYYGASYSTQDSGIRLSVNNKGEVTLFDYFVQNNGNPYRKDSVDKVFNTLGWHRIVLERSGDFGTVSVDNTVFFKNLPMIGSDNKVTISAFNDCNLTLNNFNLYLI